MSCIRKARPGDLQALAAIELEAAQLLRGHAPESVLNETTDEVTLRNAQAEGRLWVALAGDVPVGFALVETLPDGLPHLEETFRALPWNMPFYVRMGFEEIPTSRLRPALEAVVREETVRGLDPHARLVMRYRCAPGRQVERRS